MSYIWYPHRLWIVPEAARNTTKPPFSLCVHQFFWLLGMSGSTCVNTSICMTVCTDVCTCMCRVEHIFDYTHMSVHRSFLYVCTYIVYSFAHTFRGVCVYLITPPSLWLWECILAYPMAPEHHSKFHHKGVTTFPVGGRWGYRRHLGGSLLGICLL